MSPSVRPALGDDLSEITEVHREPARGFHGAAGGVRREAQRRARSRHCGRSGKEGKRLARSFAYDILLPNNNNNYEY